MSGKPDITTLRQDSQQICRVPGSPDATGSVPVIEGRSGDDELNAASYRITGTILAGRFMRFMRRWRGGRPPVACDYAMRQSQKRRSADGSPVGDPLRRLDLAVLRRTDEEVRADGGSPTGTPDEQPLGALNPNTMAMFVH